MLTQTRRRALSLLIAAIAGARTITTFPHAMAQDEEPAETNGEEPSGEELPPTGAESSLPDCFDTKGFGPWTGQASDVTAGVVRNDVHALDPEACTVLLSIEVSSELDARIFLEGSESGTALPETVLRHPDSRLIAKGPDGAVAANVPLCGNCTDIYDNTVSIVLPLATAPLLREKDSMEIVLHLADSPKECHYKLDCATMRKALDWALARRDELATERDNQKCASTEGCFITTACCEIVGLGDDCFELRALRRYRDEVLANRPGGAAEIARYYAFAPRLLARLGANAADPEAALRSIYACYVLPAALAARFGFDALAFRLYRRMLTAMSRAARTRI